MPPAPKRATTLYWFRLVPTTTAINLSSRVRQGVSTRAMPVNINSCSERIAQKDGCYICMVAREPGIQKQLSRCVGVEASVRYLGDTIRHQAVRIVILEPVWFVLIAEAQ